MSTIVRPMREDEADAVAAMVRQLPEDVGQALAPKVTGESLRANKDVVHVTVAEAATGLDGSGAAELAGVCVWTLTYSTWRGCRGLYVCDLYVVPSMRGRQVGEQLLAGTVKEAAGQGAAFIKLELDAANHRARRFYARLGFVYRADHYFTLEPAAFAALAGMPGVSAA